ncbi:hypothetical protein BH11ARM1_BH11ARM1_10090 [soil metagenome]
MDQERPKPYYFNDGEEQLHYWLIGEGKPLVVFPGLLKGSATRAAEVGRAVPSRRLICVDLPGLGGSPLSPHSTMDQRAEIIRKFVGSLGSEVDYLAFDLQGPLAKTLMAGCANVQAGFWMDAEQWEKCSHHDLRCRSLALSWDGTHLAKLWHHIRDIDILENGNPRKIGATPENYMTADELDDALLTFGVTPSVYEDLWNDALAADPIDVNHFARIDSPEALRLKLDAPAGPSGPIESITLPSPSTMRDYVDIPRGRVHLLRKGSGKRLLIALMAGPGSSSALQPLLDRLGDDFLVVAPDYIGQGKSPRNTAPTNMAQLGRDAADVAAALGFDEYLVYGTHTGAGVAIELAIQEPSRVQRLILDGVVMRRPAQRVENSPAYFPDLLVDAWGSHLLQCWNIRRDGFYFFPWFKIESQYAQHWTTPAVPVLHDRVICSLRSRTTPAYQVAICDYDATDRLALITVPTLCVAGPNDAFVKDLVLAKEVASDSFVFEDIQATIYFPEAESDLRNTTRLMIDFLNGHRS